MKWLCGNVLLKSKNSHDKEFLSPERQCLSIEELSLKRAGRLISHVAVSSVLVVLSSLWCVFPTLAEDQSLDAFTQESPLKGLDVPLKAGGGLPQGRVPFAQYERALKNSEKWETLSPEEQQEALDKIAHYRKLFRKQQSDLQGQYKALIKKKTQKRTTITRRSLIEEKDKFKEVWQKWLALSPRRQGAVSREWNIQKTLPHKRRDEVFRVWKSLLPVTRLQFLHDLD